MRSLRSEPAGPVVDFAARIDEHNVQRFCVETSVAR
jgi:hypothetical protein